MTAAGGERYILRLASPGWRCLDDLRLEALWLHALGRDTDLCVPGIVLAHDGQDVLAVSLPGDSTVWNATLMTWVPGLLLGHYLTRTNLEKMGHLFADGNHLPSSALGLLERMDRRVETAYAAIDRSDLRVIHCDLWYGNIKLYRGRLYPFDFEDTVWGFRSHDIVSI